MGSLWYKEDISLYGSSRDQPSIRISKIKSASDVSFKKKKKLYFVMVTICHV